MSTKDVTDKHVVTAYRDSVKERNTKKRDRPQLGCTQLLFGDLV